jgi:hypothetical protein
LNLVRTAASTVFRASPNADDPYKFEEQEIEREDEIIMIDRDGSEERFIHIDLTKPETNIDS